MKDNQNNKSQKEVEFNIAISDESKTLSNDLIMLFSKGQQDSKERYFTRNIPIKKDNANLILKLKNDKAYNLSNQSEKEEYYRSDGVILCIDLNNVSSTENIKAQIDKIKGYNNSDLSILIVSYSQNKDSIKLIPSDLENFCNTSKIKHINIENDTKLDISSIFIEVFTSSKLYESVQKGDYSKKSDSKSTKKFDGKRLIRRIITTFIFYGIIYFFFPDIFNRNNQEQQQQQQQKQEQ